jgi:23S rRNA pseudouridine1911/1915/1917 synthase
LIECRLETGRTHQIRVHLSEQARTPLLADWLYGRAPGDADLAAIASALGRQALHAAVLGFVHPKTSEQLRFESPLPDDMEQALAALRALTT